MVGTTRMLGLVPLSQLLKIEKPGDRDGLGTRDCEALCCTQTLHENCSYLMYPKHIKEGRYLEKLEHLVNASSMEARVHSNSLREKKGSTIPENKKKKKKRLVAE